MIKINLSQLLDLPGRNTRESVSVSGSVLTIGNSDYDLAELPDGATASHPVLGKVSRNGDDYEMTIRLPHGPNAPHETRFPEPVTVTEDGPIELPPYDEEADDDLAE